ncbi:MAG: hypothetical protein ACT4PT_06955 [Methanobacteriota archaeon]
MSNESLPVSGTEKAFYSVLKLHVYNSLYDSFLKPLQSDTRIDMSRFANGHRLELGRFTARKTNYLFVPENGNRPRCSAEFYGFTSHKVREKLVELQMQGVVELVGKGLRDAYTYRWRVPFTFAEVLSFLAVRRTTSDDLSMNLELARIHEARGFSPFSLRDFVDLYAEAHRSEYSTSRWGRRKFETLRNSFDYDNFLKLRLGKLVQHRLVLSDGASFTLNPALGEYIHHFGLFVDAVQYTPSEDFRRLVPIDEVGGEASVRTVVAILNHAETDPAGTRSLPL